MVVVPLFISAMITFKTDELKNEIKAQLLRNADGAGKFIEDEARRNLLAIDDPDWGRPYRENVVSRLLTHQVEEQANEIVIMVGVESTAKSSHHGYYIETGSATKAAQPFLVPAVFGNEAKIMELLTI